MAERKHEDVYDDKQQLGFRRVYEPQQCDRHTEGHTSKKGLHWHWKLTGHCSASNPAGIHQQCKGIYEANGTVLNCICFCHHMSRQPRKPGVLRRPALPPTPVPKKVIRVRKAAPASEAPPAAPAKSVRRIRRP